jgi:SAM-dependent methyltransferase
MKAKTDSNQTMVTEDKRSYDQILQHYLLERELAERLKRSTKAERKTLYSGLYNELFQSVPLHPQLVEKQDSSARQSKVAFQMRSLRHLLDPDWTFLELGAGDCSLSFEVANHVRKVFALDVSDEISRSQSPPENFELILSDGCTVPLPPGSVNLAYSNQLMEHLHPDDAFEQLKGVYDALVPGGLYLCITPHRYYGPSDISKYFDTEAQGFHIKEYTNSELTVLLKTAGFSKVVLYRRLLRKNNCLSMKPILILESFLEMLPARLRTRISSLAALKNILGIKVIAIK